MERCIRNFVTAAVLGLLFVSGCQSVSIDRPQALGLHAWKTDGGSPQRDRFSSSELTPPLELAWEYNASAGFGPGSPLILGDQVIVVTRKGEVHAIDWTSGERSGYKPFNEAIEGSPVLAGNTLYVTSAWGRKVLMAYDVTRSTVRWSVRGVPIEVPVVDVGETVVAVDVESHVRAYNKQTGTEIWHFDMETRGAVKSAPVLLDHTRMVIATDTGHILMLDAARGEPLWRLDLDAPVYSSSAVSDGVIVIPTTRGRLIALRAERGTKSWEFALGREDARFSGVAIGDGRVFVGATDQRIRAIDLETGKQIWETELDGVVSAPPQIAGAHVYVGTLGSQVVALDRASGAKVWSAELKGRVKSAMAVMDDALIVLSEPRYVTKFVRTTEVEDEEK